MARRKAGKAEKTYTISLAHRKARGSGHERLEEILTAARALFLEHGVENVSTRKIAEQVGISQAALFSYYKTREDILRRLVQDAFRDLGKALDEVDRTATDIKDWLRRCIAGYIAFGIEHPDEYRFAFMVIKPYKRPYNNAQPDQPEDRSTVGLDVFLRMEKTIGEAVRSGVMRADLGSSMLVAQVLWASMHGLVALLIARPHFPWEDRDALIRTQTEALLTGLLAE